MLTQSDLDFMKLAIDQARRSVREDDLARPSVGVVVASGSDILESAFRGEISLGEHAEYTVLERKLSSAVLRGATVYTTLEPCTLRTHGKLACAHRLIERRVKRVCVGMLDPNPDICGRGIWLLREAQVQTEFFPHEFMSELEELNREFIRAHRPPKMQILVKPSAETVQVVSAASVTKTEPTDSAATETATDQLLFAMYDALSEKRVSEGRAAYDKLVALTTDEAERSNHRVVYLHLYYRATGDESALSDLEGLATGEHAKGRAIAALGAIAMLGDDYALSSEKFRLAASHEQGDRAAMWLLSAAEAERKLDNSEDAASLLRSAYHQATSGSTKARIVALLAQVYSSGNKLAAKAALLAKAAQLTPLEKRRRFDAAYALSETQCKNLAAYYYNKLVENGDTGALNNLGVICGDAGLKGKATEWYERAFESGESLAGSNIAAAYFQSGLYRQASETLERAAKLTDPHERVALLGADIIRARTVEDEKWAAILESAARQGTFMIAYADAALSNKAWPWDSSQWLTHDGSIAEFSSNASRLECEWGEKDTDKRFRLLVRAFGNSGTCKLSRWTPAGRYFTDEMAGLVLLCAEGTQLRMLLDSESPIVVWNAHRGVLSTPQRELSSNEELKKLLSETAGQLDRPE